MNTQYFDSRNARAEAKPAQQARAALRRAEAQTDGPTCEVWHADYLSFVRDAVTLSGGPNIGLDVGVITSPGRQTVEVQGHLPAELRRGLQRVRAYWDRPRRGWVSWDAAPVVWHTRRSRYGPRYAIRSLGALLDLVSERRLELDGGRA